MFTLYSADFTGNPGNCSYPHKTVVMNTDNLREAVCHDYVCAEYKNHYRNGENFISADLPGFGDSALPPGGTDADAMLAPLAAGLRQLVGRAPVDLVGFSLGGMTAGMLLAAHPGLARRLVLVGAPALGLAPAQPLALRAWRHLGTPAEQQAAHRHNLGRLMLHDARHIDALALQVHTAHVVRDRLPRRRLSKTNILARSLAQVPCPVWAIYGEHDVLYEGQMRALADALAKAAPDCRGLRIIEGAGHWVQYEAPAAFDAALAGALRG